MNAFKGRLSAGTLLAAASTFALGAVASAPAIAQTNLANVDVVTVTARKQTESLQTVPVTVTAVGGQAIDRFNYDKIADIVSRIPTLNVQVGGSGSGGQLSLRGIGSSNISAAFDSAVAFDFDGVQVATMRIVQSAFFDMQQIEVLKGPQSLFFGKSASGGVISLKSKGATDELEIGGKFSYELEERGITTEAYVSGPLSDKAGFRLAARYNNISRLIYAEGPNSDPKKGEENINLRATFEVDPTDNFSANLKLNYIRQNKDSALGNAVYSCGDNGIADDITLLSGSLIIPAGYDCDTRGNYYYRTDAHPALSVQAQDQDLNGGQSFGESDIFFGRLELEWDVTDELTITSVTGYLDQSAHDLAQYGYGGILADGSPGGVGGGLVDYETEQFTQEVRLTTNYDGPINGMIGVFYESRDILFATNQHAVNIGLVSADPVTGNSSDYFKQHFYDNEALSIWASLIWNITDDLELSGGVRWTDEKKVNNIVVPYVHSFLAGGAFIESGYVSPDIIFKDDNFSPEVTLSYQVNDDVNLYGSFKTGFKSGGIDNSALPSAGLLGIADPDPEVAAATAAGLIYDSETAKGGEVGAKMQFSDRTVTLNVAGFYYVYEDLQVQNFDAVAIQFATSNASELTTKGIDIDFNWLTPVDGVSIFGALAYTRTKYTKPFDPNKNDGDVTELNGRFAARAPKWAGNIGVDYRAPFANGLELGLTGNMQFSSSYFTNEDSLNDHIQGSYATFDIAASVGDIDGRWEIAIIARNLADKRFVNTSGSRPFLTAAGDDEVWNLNRGRHVFFEGSVNF